MPHRELSREEVITRIKKVLVEMDGVTLEDVYNLISANYGDHVALDYQGDGIFIKDRGDDNHLIMAETLDALTSLHQDYIHALPEAQWDMVVIEKCEKVISKAKKQTERKAAGGRAGRILDQQDVVAKVTEVLLEIDGHTLENLFNTISRDYGSGSLISYSGDDIFSASSAPERESNKPR